MITAPETTSAIPNGQAQITGGFTQAEATQLQNVLQYGSLPLNFKILTADTVSASLGRAQLVGGLIAAAIGLALVVIYSFLYYRGLGLVSVSSLLIAGTLALLAVMLLTKYQNFALELSGIAGLIVAIGITADSFVVFFERLRDEVREGKQLRPAVEAGWKRARRTILVSDTVSFIAAILLYYFSIGEVKGFAYTLGLTTLIDVIVVFLFTKPMVTLLARTKFFGNGHPLSGLDPARLGARTPWRSSVRRTQVRRRPDAAPRSTASRNTRGGVMSRLGQIGSRLYRGEVSYDFVGRQRRWYTISAAILLISIVALFARGLDFSVDFKGGAVFQFSAPAATQTEVQDTVSHDGRQRCGRPAADRQARQQVLAGSDRLADQPADLHGRERADQPAGRQGHEHLVRRGELGRPDHHQGGRGPDHVPDRDRAVPVDRLRMEDGGGGLRGPHP